MGRWSSDPLDSDVVRDVSADLTDLLGSLSVGDAMAALKVRYADVLLDTDAQTDFWRAVKHVLGRTTEPQLTSSATAAATFTFDPGGVYEYTTVDGSRHHLLWVLGLHNLVRGIQAPLLAVLDWSSESTVPISLDIDDLSLKEPRQRWPPEGYNLRTGAFPGTTSFVVAPGDASDDYSVRLAPIGSRGETESLPRSKLNYAWWDKIDPYLEFLFLG